MPNVAHRIHAKVTMADGSVVAAAIDERDLRKWDMTYKVKGWPSKNEAEFLYQGYIAAAAIVRAGGVDNLTNIEKVLDLIVAVEIETDETVNPTELEPGSG